MRHNQITDINALEIIDNRGNPTLRVSVCMEDRFYGRGDVPSGSSTGGYEAVELRDGEARYNGKGVRKAISHVLEKIRPELIGLDGTNQRAIDNLMLSIDGTSNKSNLGGNAILGVSLAVARAASQAVGFPLYRYLNAGAHILPVPQACLINGGLHAGNDLDVQEYCVMPVGAENFTHAVQILCEIFTCLREILLTKIGKVAVNSSEDGGFAPPLSSSFEAMEYLTDAVKASGYVDKIVYGLDLAAGGFLNIETGLYTFEGKKRTAEGMKEFIADLIQEYPAIISIEDPLGEDDLDGWKMITDSFSEIMIIGDDLFATNKERLTLGMEKKIANATLCKVNQIGTLTEAMDAARFAQRNHYPVVMSVRSGETEDDILSDISVALDSGLFKTGGIRGSDRGTNYNRFMEIEAELGESAVYAGNNYKRLLPKDGADHTDDKQQNTERAND